MSVGVYKQKDAITVFVDHGEYCEELHIVKQQHENRENDADYQWLFHDFMSELYDLLPTSFDTVVDTWDYGYSSGDVSRQILAEKGIYRISVADYWNGVAEINVELRQVRYSDSMVFDPLAVYLRGLHAKYIFEQLVERFELRVRTSDWVTGRNVKPTEKLAA